MRFRFRRFLFLICLVGLGLWNGPLGAQHPLPRPEKLTYREGLPQAFVSALTQDRQGFIWMATRDGLCRYDGSTFKVFQPDPGGRPSLSFTNILALKTDRRGRLWVASGAGALDVFDPRTETFLNYSRQPFFQNLLGAVSRGSQFSSYLVDRSGILWLYFWGRGVASVSPGTNRVRWYRHQANDPASLSSDSVTALCEDRQGVIWAATPRGLDRLDRKTGRIRHFHPEPGNPESLPESAIAQLLPLPNGDLLVFSPRFVTVFAPDRRPTRIYPLPAQRSSSDTWGVHPAIDSRGVVYFNQQNTLCRFTPEHGPEVVATLPNLQCMSLWVDRSDVLWMGTNGSGVWKYDLRAVPFQTKQYRENFMIDLFKTWLGVPGSDVPPVLNQVVSYQFRSTLDTQNGLWFNVGRSPFYRLDLTTRRITPVAGPTSSTPNFDDPPRIPMATDAQGTVWVVQDSSVFFFPRGERAWRRFRHPLRLPVRSQPLQVVVDESALWLATESQGLFRLDRQTGQLRAYPHQPNNPTSLSNNALLCLFADPSDASRLWVGTFGSGLCAFDKRSGSCQRITVANGLPNNVVYAAIPDRQGFLWVATNQGLCRLNRRTFATQNFTSDDGLLADEFNRFHFLLLPDDRLFLGGIEGITAVETRAFRPDAYQPQVEMTTLSVNNRPLVAGPESPTGWLPPQAVNRLDLPYDQNFLTVRFAALQFNRRGKNAYRYRLDGVDETWVSSPRPEAGYTNLSPGTYTLELNAANTSGVWSPHVRTLEIIIRPPFWATWWAYLGYGLVAAGVAFGLIRLYLNRLQLQQAVRLRQREAEQLRHLDELKSQFFANITHEFRTPLTLILNSTEQLEKTPADPRRPERFATVRRNADQLLRLITQLLDAAKLDAGRLLVKRSVGNPDEFMGQLVASFAAMAEKKGVGLSFQGGANQAVFFDEEKLEKIGFNLLSNALKFTPEGGRVDVRITNYDLRYSYLVIQVSDTGPGIPPEQLPRIFERFYQVDASSTRAYGGTGIGLAFVKELTELLGGTVRVESVVGEGSTFTVEIPAPPARSRAAPEGGATRSAARLRFQSNTSELVPSAERGSNGAPPSGRSEGRTPDGSAGGASVLVVEDNDELRQYLVETLLASYRVHAAVDGRAGLDAAIELVPDLILSDVMMPRMDGYALLGALKADLRTSHIPVILLTAKSSYDSKLRGLGLGADAYLSKPFSLDELTLTLRNTLQTRRAWQAVLAGSAAEKTETGERAIPEKEAQFLERLKQLLLRHLQDEAVDVDWLAQQANMSRTQLHRKLTALTNRSTTWFIHRVRLEKAEELLREGSLNVAEVAFQVGYNSQSYFTKLFQEQFGQLPTKLRA